MLSSCMMRSLATSWSLSLMHVSNFKHAGAAPFDEGGLEGGLQAPLEGGLKGRSLEGGLEGQAEAGAAGGGGGGV